jgi:hypothetical protein
VEWKRRAVKVSLAGVVLLAGCGGTTHVSAISFQIVHNPLGRDKVMTLRQGSAFMKIAALLPKHLPHSTPRVPSFPYCYEAVFTVLLSDGSKRLYGPCLHPRSIRPALRSACVIYALSPYNAAKRNRLSRAEVLRGCEALR